MIHLNKNSSTLAQKVNLKKFMASVFHNLNKSSNNTHVCRTLEEILKKKIIVEI